MTITAHQISVVPFKAGLKSLDAILDKAKAWAETKKIDPNALLQARLAPDMFNLARQVQAVTDQSRNCARLAGTRAAEVRQHRNDVRRTEGAHREERSPSSTR